MPITITWPPVGGSFGPGFELQVSTDVIGPLPVDNLWHVQVVNIDNDAEVQYEDTFATQDHLARWTFMSVPIAQPAQPQRPWVIDGKQVRLLVRRLEGGVQVESLSQQVVWDMRSGLPFWEQSRGGAQEGSFTEQDRLQLQETNAAVIRKMGVAPQDLDIPISDLVTHPPFGLLRIRAGFTPASGDGLLGPPEGDSSRWIGLWWEFVQVPPGLGFQLGAKRLWQLRMMQLVTIFDLGALEIGGQVENADYDRVLWLWNEPFPKRVEYSVLPGVVANIHYVVLLGQE